MPPTVMLVAPEDHLAELEGQMKAATKLVPFKLEHSHNSVEAISKLKKACSTRDGVLAAFIHSRYLSGAKEEYSDTLRKYLKSNEPDIPVIAFGKRGDCGEEGKTYNSFMDTESGSINPRVAASAIQAVLNGSITGGREGKGAAKGGSARKSVDLARKSVSSQDGARRSIDGRPGPSEGPTRRASLDLRASMGPGSPTGSSANTRRSSMDAARAMSMDMPAMGSPYYGAGMGPSPLGGMMGMPQGGGMGGNMGGMGGMGAGMMPMSPRSPMAPMTPMAPMAPMMGMGMMPMTPMNAMPAAPAMMPMLPMMQGGMMGGAAGGMSSMNGMVGGGAGMSSMSGMVGGGSGMSSMSGMLGSPASMPAMVPSMPAAAAPVAALEAANGGSGELIKALAEEVVRLRTALAQKRGVAVA